MDIRGGRRHLVDLLFTLALFCVFAAACLIVIYIGSDVYRSTVQQMDTSFEVNTPVTYVAARIRQHDREGSVNVSTLGGEPALVLEQELGGQTFQTWIYYHEGSLRELFINSENTAALIPGAGQPLVSVYSFDVEMALPGLVSVSAASEDGVSASKLVGLRSGG